VYLLGMNFLVGFISAFVAFLLVFGTLYGIRNR
jgi:hypothetical protein